MFRLLLVCLVLASAAIAAVPQYGWAASFSDPTRPPSAMPHGEVMRKQIVLQSVLYSNSSGRSLAIINGRSYAVGDRSPLGKIERIDRDGITVAGSDGQRVVKLQRDLNKQMVADKQ